MRVLVFSGLEHHLKRMTGVLAALGSRGDEVELVTSQNPWCCHRSDFATALGDRPHHALSDLHSEPAFHARLRGLRRDLAARLARCFAAGTSPAWYVNETPLAYSLAEVLEDRVACDLLLERLAPDAVLVLHENNFWTRTLGEAAASAGVPVISFQEGTFYAVFPESLLREHGRISTRILLWGEGDRERLAHAGVARCKLRVIGPPHLDEVVARWTGPAETRARLGWPSEPHVAFVAPNLGVAAVADGFVEQLGAWVEAATDRQLVLKWRAVESHPSRTTIERRLAARLGSRLRILDRSDPYDVLAACDLVLGQATTLGAEAAALGCPYIEVAWEGSGAEVTGLEHSGVPLLVGPDDFRLAESWLGDGPTAEVSDRIASWRRETFGPVDGRAVARALDEIDLALAAPTPSDR